MVRPAGSSPSAEAWHRDEAPTAEPNDVIFGGWINLDDKPQTFSCVPGTHKGVSGHGGFAPIPKEERPVYKKRSVKVNIPSGHVLVFNEKLVHEVYPKKMKYDSYRLFLGWRRTDCDKPLMACTYKNIKLQAPMTLKSGQRPPIYGKLHWTNWRDRTVRFSKGVRGPFKEKRMVKSGKCKGRTLTVVMRVMPGLLEVLSKRECYPPYSKEELEIYAPQYIKN